MAGSDIVNFSAEEYHHKFRSRTPANVMKSIFLVLLYLFLLPMFIAKLIEGQC